MYLITPPNGLLSQYLQNNAINYTNNDFNNPQFQGMPTSFSFLIEDGQEENQSDIAPCRVNFKLTKSILNFNKVVFDIPDRFTKYIFIEEVMLFYIRTHYINFVRLYNKNFHKKSYESKETSLELCKKHIECLFAIAKNRNEDTRRKLY